MNTTTKRWLFGCLGGCLVLIVALVGGCVGFTFWLRSPGELLEPETLLDPLAVGYVEGRFELDNPGTEAMLEMAQVLMQVSEPPMDSPVLEALMSWNRNRQLREMRRMFPARVVWTIYPGEVEGSTESVFSISIQRAGHQLVLTDWIANLILPRIPEVPLLEHRGERIVVIEEQRRRSSTRPSSGVEVEAEPEAPKRAGLKLYLFLRGEGIFFTTGEQAARRAIDRLAGVDEETPARNQRLEPRLAEVSPELQIRGTLSSPQGELISIASFLTGAESPSDPAFEPLRHALAPVDVAILGGGFLPSGDAVLEVEMRAQEPLPELREELSKLFTDLPDEVPIEWTIDDSGRGLTLKVTVVDLPRVLEEKIEKLRQQGTTVRIH